MTIELDKLAEADDAWRQEKFAIEEKVEAYRQELLAGPSFSLLTAARAVAAHRAREAGHSMRKIALALHTKATVTAYEAINAGAPAATDATHEFRLGDEPLTFVVTPPIAHLRAFAVNMFEAGDQTSATYRLDVDEDRIVPVDKFTDADGKTNPVLKYVAQTKGYLGRAYEWAKGNVTA